MLKINIPGFGKVALEHLVFDYNGTLAVNGELIAGVKEKLNQLSSVVNIHIVTADTFGKAAAQLQDVSCKLHILLPGNEDQQKLDYIQKLGNDNAAAFGNGNNDQQMIRAARVGIVVIEKEGCSGKTLQAADIVVKSINDGLDLLLNPLRIKATVRF